LKLYAGLEAVDRARRDLGAHHEWKKEATPEGRWKSASKRPALSIFLAALIDAEKGAPEGA